LEEKFIKDNEGVIKLAWWVLDPLQFNNVDVDVDQNSISIIKEDEPHHYK